MDTVTTETLTREYFTLAQESWRQMFGKGSRNRKTDERLQELEIKLCELLEIPCFWAGAPDKKKQR